MPIHKPLNTSFYLLQIAISGNIQKDDRATHGIQVINNLYELKEWIRTSIVNK
jgi:hypothetical protein